MSRKPTIVSFAATPLVIVALLANWGDSLALKPAFQTLHGVAILAKAPINIDTNLNVPGSKDMQVQLGPNVVNMISV
jgi:hypothetical protein